MQKQLIEAFELLGSIGGKCAYRCWIVRQPHSVSGNIAKEAKRYGKTVKEKTN